MHIILNEIKAKECYPYVPFDERRMSVGADLGRSYNVIPTSERPPVRICGGPSDIQRMFCMSQYDIWRTSVGLPCAMWALSSMFPKDLNIKVIAYIVNFVYIVHYVYIV